MSVFVTGATGFLALHIVDTLLADGYTVVGTARSEAKYSPIIEEFKKKYPQGKLSFEIVADVGAEGAFDEALKKHPEIKYVLHTASPFSFGLEKPLKEAYLDPAVNGTLNALKSVKKYAPQVTRFVVTSSFASISHMKETKFITYTNNEWNPIKEEEITNEVEAYYASKTFAEKAAWDYVEEEKPNFALTTICPPYIFGPQVFDSFVGKTLNTSNAIIQAVSKTDPATTTYVDQPSGFAVDVRDVSKFHKYAFEKESTKGQRLFICESFWNGQSILNILNKNFPELKLAKGDAKAEITPASGFDVSNVVELVGGYKFISAEESLVDVVKQFIQVSGSWD